MIALAISYVGPIRGFLATRAELRTQEVALKSMVRERDAIRAQIAALDNPAVVEARARQLGYMKPGEIPYRVTGLDGAPPPRAAARAKSSFWDWLPDL